MNSSNFFNHYKGYTIGAVFLLLIFIGGWGYFQYQKKGVEEEQETVNKPTVKIVYVDWASERASANVVKAVIEKKMNMNCELTSVSLIAMWESIVEGDQDATVAAWLPTLQDPYYSKFKSEVDYLGHNLEGTRIGLVVPEYVNIDSIQALKKNAEKFDSKIIGIDPQAGLMTKTDSAIEKYELDNFNLVSGSGPTMTTALERAISEKRWIVVTGWTPHWKFAKWDLKYLKDPKKVYGDDEYIDTVARKGLKEEMPGVYNFLKHFHWAPADMEKVMLWSQEEQTSYFEAAKRWVEKNDNLVNSWINGN